ncbi:MAG: response regulator, partial [Lachnospiraceae bacterium]|nr:response regulator [Lachnospiraceae bacterium]
MKDIRKKCFAAALAVICFACCIQRGTLTAAAEGIERIGGGYAASGQIDGKGFSAELFDASNGLPTSDANCILGSSDGYIWIGGYSGIIRYNGSSFERLDTSGGLTSGRYIFEDSRKRIWVATNDNGVVVLQGENSWHFTYKDGLTSSSFRAFAEDASGNIFMGSTAGVSYVDPNMNLHLIKDDRLDEERILRLEADSTGRIYGVTRNGKVFSIDNTKISSYYEGKDLGVESVSTLMADKDNPGKVYMCTVPGTLYYGNFGDSVDKMEVLADLPFDKAQWMSYDCGRIWVCSTYDICYYDEKDGVQRLNALPVTNGIEMITSDYQGNIWAASSTQGVMKIVSNNFVNISERLGALGELANTVCISNGNIYVGGESGADVFTPDGEWIYGAISELLAGSRIRCIMEDNDGNIWFSAFTNGHGLVCLSKDGTIKEYNENAGMPGHEIRGTALADDGSVLVATNLGLAVIKDGEVVRKVDASNGMKNTVLLTVCQGPDGTVLCGSDGDGIYVVKGNEIEKRIGREDGLTSDVIMRIKKDEKRGLYWIVTSNSIQYLKNDELVEVTTFPYNNNYDFFVDDNDNMWILSSLGVYIVNADEMAANDIKEYRLYTNANGLTSTPTSNSYSTLTKDGILYIAGREGVTRVDTAHFFDEKGTIKLSLDSIYADNTRIPAGESGAYTLSSKAGRVKITAAVLDYTMTDPTVRVYLEGTGDSGITIRRSKLTPLEYTGLKYGTYTLHIQILDNINGTILQEETYKIVKRPRLTELFIVKFLFVLLLIFASGLVVWRFVSNKMIRKQYDEIRQAKDEAVRANTAKSRFLANMSHEIRTPINTIMGMDEMIMREDATGVPKGYFMSIMNYSFDIRNAAESLLGLINDVLDISKIESGKMHLVEQAYDLQDVLRSIVSMIRVKSTEKELKFDVSIDEMMPKHLYGDAGKIKQIVLNLLTNAVKYTDVGGFVLDVSMLEREDDECKIRFSVKDTGIGIKTEDIQKLFTAYERLDEEKNSGIQGTGLGLDISRRFAELMGGTLTCNSIYGEGSEFVLIVTQKITDMMPFGEFTEHDDVDATGPYIPQFVAPDADILVVDDNPMNLNVMRGLLKATKMFVTTASSGEECLEKIKETKFNIILLDHMMPGMDGIETLEKIREIDKDIPVYALTANTAVGEDFYKSKGFNGYLSKPVDSRVLEKTIMSHLPEEMMMKPDESYILPEITEIPEDMKWINETEGISVPDGTKASGGLANFFFSLQMFLDTIDGNAKVLKNALEGGDIKL